MWVSLQNSLLIIIALYYGAQLHMWLNWVGDAMFCNVLVGVDENKVRGGEMEGRGDKGGRDSVKVAMREDNQWGRAMKLSDERVVNQGWPHPSTNNCCSQESTDWT